jgi:enoyl-CoA hydratase/carnithine racemase
MSTAAASADSVSSFADDALVVHDDAGGVRRIVFNRPQQHNAQNVEMLRALDRALDDTSRRRDVRVVVLSGTGRSFCAGHDLREMSVNAAYRENASTVEGRFAQELALFVEPVRKFRELRQPSVCRVQGHCLAAGLMFAASADFVIAAENAVFGSPVVRALAVNDAEVMSFALRVGERLAKRVFWLDERITADEALRAGLATWVVPPADLDAKVDEVVARLLTTPPEVLALSKESFLFMAERMGERDVNRFHFVNHQLSHWTAEARALLDERMDRLGAGGSSVPERPAPTAPENGMS